MRGQLQVFLGHKNWCGARLFWLTIKQIYQDGNPPSPSFSFISFSSILNQVQIYVLCWFPHDLMKKDHQADIMVVEQRDPPSPYTWSVLLDCGGCLFLCTTCKYVIVPPSYSDTCWQLPQLGLGYVGLVSRFVFYRRWMNC